eukprot:scaffold13512_cov72-Cyclotella_meneghiniana.AAC.1
MFVITTVKKIGHVRITMLLSLSDAGKEIFRRFILATGTQLCLDATKEKDLTKETTVAYSACSIIMIVIIEMREKYNLAQNIDISHEVTINYGAEDSNFQLEFLVSVNDILFCPRQAIKFFHRRNSCACLQELYYKLKETTKKTSRCNYCSEVREIRQMSKCEYCNVFQYCSYDCALAHWPTHKMDCERMGYYKPTKPTKSSDCLEECCEAEKWQGELDS